MTIKELKEILEQYNDEQIIGSNTWAGYYSEDISIEEVDGVVTIVGLE